MQYWLVKTEPEEYSFDDLINEGKAIWDGIRNYQARNNLKKMKKGDKVLVYHTGKKKEIAGIAEIIKEYYKDPKDNTNTWVVVELKALKKLTVPFPLLRIKDEIILKGLPLLKQSRLSVMPVSESEYKFIVK